MTQKRGPTLTTQLRGPPPRMPSDDPRELRAIPPAGIENDGLATSTEIERALGETIKSILDFANWEEGGGLAALSKAQAHLAKSIHHEATVLTEIRRHVLNSLAS